MRKPRQPQARDECRLGYCLHCGGTGFIKQDYLSTAGLSACNNENILIGNYGDSKTGSLVSHSSLQTFINERMNILQLQRIVLRQ